MSVAEELRPRARAMAERVALAARRAGIDDDGVRQILTAYLSAMRVRDRVIEDEHQIDYLHPGRTALILIEDLGVMNAEIVAAATLLESLHDELRVDIAGDPAIDSGVSSLVERIPTPGRSGELLIEDLLVAAPEIRTIALAEWLDQVRRLHLRPTEYWEGQYALTSAVYLPIAERTDRLLAQRFNWWCRVFKDRYLRGGG